MTRWRSRICFVCTGNICRSPMAEIVLRHEASAIGLSQHLVIDSAGTAAVTGWDIDPKAKRALERRGYEPHRHRGRQFEPAWFPERDLVIALDQGHSTWLRRRAPDLKSSDSVKLLLSYGAAPGRPPAPLDVRGRPQAPGAAPRPSPAPLDVPDPYLGDDADFESCLDLVQAACAGLLDSIAIELDR